MIVCILYMYIRYVLKSSPALLGIALVVSIFFIPLAAVWAQSSAGVRISPAIIEDRLDLATEKTYTITIENTSSIDQAYYLSARNIIGVQDGGVPIFSAAGTETNELEISSWINLSQTRLEVPVGGAETVSFTIKVPEVAAPGGHFGAVIVSVEPPEIRSTGAAIGYEVANIISIRLPGEAQEEARIRQFSTSKFVYGSKNVDFEVKIENLGNTLIKPMGPLVIKSMFGNKVADLMFNDSRAAIFPKTTRTYTQTWQEEELGFGRYEAVLSAVYGDEGSIKTISNSVTFWILPFNIIMPAAGGLLLLFLIAYFIIKAYVRRTVALMSGGASRRIVRQQNQNRFPILLLLVVMLSLTALFLMVLLLLFA